MTYEIDDLWMKAFNALDSVRFRGHPEKIECDPKPLVRLLRSDTPMTPRARELLAELLSPGNPPICDFMLVPKRVGEFDKMFGPKWDAVRSYIELRNAGKSSESAAEEAGEDHLVTGRQIHRYRAKFKELGERLMGKNNSTKSR
jgi:hypothetical protein